MTTPAVFEAGQRVGSLIVIGRLANDEHGNRRWSLRCDCGALVTRMSNVLNVAVARGSACCDACRSLRRVAGHARYMDRRYFRERWREHGSLYAEHEVEHMCVEVDDALIAAFGRRGEREPAADELQWGRRQVSG